MGGYTCWVINCGHFRQNSPFFHHKMAIDIHIWPVYNIFIEHHGPLAGWEEHK